VNAAGKDTRIPLAVELIAQSQGPGRYICPKCAGGSDSEKSLSIRVDEAGGVHWRCFRALCGYTGGPRGVRSIFATKKKEPRYFTRPIKPLTDLQQIFLLDKFASFPLMGEVEGYSYWDDRFILGVYGPEGYNKRGVVAYSFNQKPKTLTYNEKPDEPFIHYAMSLPYGGAAHSNVVIVEDWFSAEKVAATGYAVGVALMGTNLDQAMVSEIAGYANSRGAKTWIALDRDAYTKSLLYLNKYREQFGGGLFAWSLAKDLKYETTERITEALVDGKTDFIRHAQQQENL
jgi:hypothetical protein